MPDSKSVFDIDPSFHPLLLSLTIEILLYVPFVTIYFFFILKWAKAWLFDL